MVGVAVGVIGETKWSVRVVVWCSDSVVAGVDSVVVMKVFDGTVSVVVSEG